MSEIEEKDKQNQKPELEDFSFDILGLLFEYLAQWKWFVLCIAIAFGISYYYLAKIVPTYEVSASVYINDEQSQASKSAVTQMNNPMVEMKNYLDETEIEILRSRNNLIKTVDSLNLSYAYYEVGRFRDNPIYGTNGFEAELDSISLRSLSSSITAVVEKPSDEYIINVKTKLGDVPEEKTLRSKTLPVTFQLSQGTLKIKPSTTTSAINGKQKVVISNPSSVASALSGNLFIEYAHNSGTILRFRLRTPLIPQGKAVINTLIDIYNRDIIADKNRSAMQTEAFIVERLASVSGELKDVEKDYEDYRRERRITDLSSETGMYLSQTSATDQQIGQLDAQSQIISRLEKQVNTSDNYEAIPAVGDQTLNPAIEEYNRKVEQRAALLEGSTEDNPLIQRLQDDINRSKVEIQRGIQNAKQALAIQRGQVYRIDSRAAGKLSNVPTYERELAGIFREQRIKDNIYNFLLERREEIALQKTLATPTAKLIDNPQGSGPVAPRRQSYYGLALLIGILIPAVLIFLRRLIFPIFKDKDDLERMTNMPILGEIGLAEKGVDFVITENDTSANAELFRLLRNNIQFAGSSKDKKVFLVTSSLSGEGKTFVASNIAMSYALTGKRTLVVGMDIRRPNLARRFGLDNNVGITTYLSNQTDDIDSIIMPSGKNDNLSVMAGGPIPPNPNELLLSDRLGELFTKLRDMFDVVIIDSAPIGVVSDTFLIAPVSDIQIYVTRANYSTKRCLKIMHNAVTTGRFPNCYVVLNAVNMKSGSYTYRKFGHYYGSYSKYGKYGKAHSYGYGYSHSETPTLKSRLSKLRRKIKR